MDVNQNILMEVTENNTDQLKQKQEKNKTKQK